MQNSTIASGCMVGNSSFERCMLGVRSIVGNDCSFKNVVMMGSDAYESFGEQDLSNPNYSSIPIGVGDSTSVENAIC